jgi:pyridoxine 5-phosphate synthase
MSIRLSVNVDHIATIREARKTDEPDPVMAALLTQMAGADGVTVHLRSDRRHINERDLKLILQTITIPVTLEMAATGEMLQIAAKEVPHVVTLVPERPEEITTEGGLDVVQNFDHMKTAIDHLHKSGIKACIFVNPDLEQIGEAKRAGADMAEINTGIWAEADNNKKGWELERIKKAIEYTNQIGVKATAGHGITYRNVKDLIILNGIYEFSIGHTIISRAAFTGLQEAVKEMKNLLK